MTVQLPLTPAATSGANIQYGNISGAVRLHLHAPLPQTHTHTICDAHKRRIDETLAQARLKVVLFVNRRQAQIFCLNPVFRYVRHVRLEVRSGVEVADFQCGACTIVFYLSLPYHRLHPSYTVSILDFDLSLCHHHHLPVYHLCRCYASCANHVEYMHELSKLALLSKITILVATSLGEAARYLETLCSYDAKGADGIQERAPDDYASCVNAAFSSIRGVNRTDVSTFEFTFGGFKAVALADIEQLRECPGLGPRKVERLYRAMYQPFKAHAEWTEMELDVGAEEDGEEDIDGDDDEEEVSIEQETDKERVAPVNEPSSEDKGSDKPNAKRVKI